MIIAGLTGSIAMGKSTVAGHVRRARCPDIRRRRGRARLLRRRQGESGRGGVSRRLGLGPSTGSALHRVCWGTQRRCSGLKVSCIPQWRRRAFSSLKRAAAEGRRLVIVDVPLLFETGGEASVDLVIVVSAPDLSSARALLARSGHDRSQTQCHSVPPNVGRGKKAAGPFRHRYGRQT